MECGSCGRAAPAGSRFCPHCGAQQVLACTGCARPLADDARFCASCGTPAPGTQAAVAPDPLAQQPVAERRVASVLFGDLVGFTPLSEARDAEEVRELLSGYFQRCRTIVARYGGTVEKFIGDAVMAVWGVPVAHEDDAERAVRAGLDLLDMIERFGVSAGVPELAMRVGVVTGEVAVTLGAEAEGMVAGDSVNTAARVQSCARPGALWADRQTRFLSAGAIEFTSAGEHELKGKAAAVELFEAVAVEDAVVGTPRIARVEAPLIGRRHELSVLHGAFDAAAEVPGGHVLVIAGEPGVGKTRLGRELQRYADGLAHPVRWHWGRALAYGDGVAFSPLASALRGRVGATELDDPSTIGAKIVRSLEQLGVDAATCAWLQPRLSVLLTGGDADFSRDELFAAWLVWFDALGSDGNPVVWVIDDAQHADDGVLDFVDHVAGACSIPLFVVLLTRPELLARRPHLVTSRRTTVLNVEGLSRMAMAGLVGRLTPHLPAAALDNLIRSAEGIPLYAVEFVRSMLDQGLLVQDADGSRVPAAGVTTDQLTAVSAPTSLRVLVSSRLDALPPADRTLLGTAAVLGGSFTPDGLAALTGLGAAEIRERLRPLVHRDLLRVEADHLSAEYGEYAFVQTIVRQVAYQTQSRRDRAERHLAAADHLETLPEAAGQLIAVIAGHLNDAVGLLPTGEARSAEVSARAVIWHERAGDRARSLGAPLESLASYDAALSIEADPAAIARLRLAAADVAITAGRYDRAIAHAAAVGRDQPLRQVARADTAHAQALRRSGENDAARDLLQPWLERVADLPAAEGSDLTRELAFTWHQLGDLERAVPIGEQAMRLAEDSGRPDLIVRALNVLGVHNDLRGLWRSGRALYAAAAALGRVHELTTELGFVLHNLSTLELSRDPSAGIRTAREALDLAQRTGHISQANYAATNLIEGMRTTGRWNEAIAVGAEPVIGDSIAAGLLDVRQIGLDLGLIALARGEAPPSLAFRDRPARTGVVGTDTGTGADDLEADDPITAAVHAAVRDDIAAAFELASVAVRATHAESGLEDDFTVTWTAAIDWGIAAGRVDEARDLLTLVADAPAGQITPVLAAQLLRLGGSIEATAWLPSDRAERADSITAQLEAAAAALDLLDAAPYAALAREAHGSWLARSGRRTEAAALLGSARTVFLELDAVRWIARLDRAAGHPARAAG